MENELKNTLQLSLEELTLRKVAVLFSTESNILTSISKSRYNLENQTNKQKWQETIVDKIKNNVKKLGLPPTLINPIMDRIRPITLDIKRWTEIHQAFLKDSHGEIIPIDSRIFHWTPEGAINYRKTAEKLMSCEGLDLVRRYEIASYYCLEDSIRLLWEELPEDKKEYFGNNENLSLELPFCWPHIVKGEFSKLNNYVRRKYEHLENFNQVSFERSAKKGNKTAAAYFYQKLTDRQRKYSLKTTALDVLQYANRKSFFPRERHSDLIRFLLSAMSPQKQMEIVKACPVEVFTCFLDWPWQELFLENVELLWTVLHPYNYDSLLKKVVYRLEDPYFVSFFKEILNQSPSNFRKAFAGYFLSMFFDSKNSESIVTMFRVVDAANRLEFISNNMAFNYYFRSILFDGLDRMKLLLEKATLCEEDKRKLKEAFAQFLENTVRGECVNRQFEEFFALLD